MHEYERKPAFSPKVRRPSVVRKKLQPKMAQRNALCAEFTTAAGRLHMWEWLYWPSDAEEFDSFAHRVGDFDLSVLANVDLMHGIPNAQCPCATAEALHVWEQT